MPHDFSAVQEELERRAEIAAEKSKGAVARLSPLASENPMNGALRGFVGDAPVVDRRQQPEHDPSAG